MCVVSNAEASLKGKEWKKVSSAKGSRQETAQTGGDEESVDQGTQRVKKLRREMCFQFLQAIRNMIIG